MSNPTPRPGSDEEWAELLRQLQRQAPAQPRPFFYARVRTRLAARLPPETHWLPNWMRRPAYVVLLGALGLAVSGDGVAPTPHRGPQPAAFRPR